VAVALTLEAAATVETPGAAEAYGRDILEVSSAALQNGTIAEREGHQAVTA
jgi:hypothetical protein